MDLGLLRGDAALAHEVGDDAVVLGELHELAVAEAGSARLSPTLAMSRCCGLVAVGVGRGSSGSGSSGTSARATTVVPMPRRFGSASPSLRIRWFATSDRLGERVGGGLLVGDLERLDGEARRHLAALVAAHAVGDDEQVAVGQRARRSPG